MKRFIQIITMLAVMLLIATSVVTAQRTVETTYTESYRWHGFNIYPSNNYVHPGVKAEIVDGVEVGTVTHVTDNLEDDFDTTIAVGIPIIDGICITGGYGYLILPGMDAQELSLTAQLPGTIAPRYTVVHIIPDNDENGQVHVLGVDVAFGDLSDPNAISAILTTEATYNDGVNPFGPTVHEWTHLTAGLTVNVPAGRNMILQPGVICQYTLDDAIGPNKNEIWYTVGLIRKF